MGYVHGPANIKAKLVITERRRKVCGDALVAGPSVGVQFRISEVFVNTPVELLATALGNDADLSARSASIFR